MESRFSRSREAEEPSINASRLSFPSVATLPRLRTAGVISDRMLEKSVPDIDA
jgi:hypothetical protein